MGVASIVRPTVVPRVLLYSQHGCNTSRAASEGASYTRLPSSYDGVIRSESQIHFSADKRLKIHSKCPAPPQTIFTRWQHPIHRFSAAWSLACSTNLAGRKICKNGEHWQLCKNLNQQWISLMTSTWQESTPNWYRSWSSHANINVCLLLNDRDWTSSAVQPRAPHGVERLGTRLHREWQAFRDSYRFRKRHAGLVGGWYRTRPENHFISALGANWLC